MCVCGTVAGVSVQQVALWSVWDSWVCECEGGGFVMCVFGIIAGVSVQQVALWSVWDSWRSECAAGGFVECVGQLGN